MIIVDICVQKFRINSNKCVTWDLEVQLFFYLFIPYLSGFNSN